MESINLDIILYFYKVYKWVFIFLFVYPYLMGNSDVYFQLGINGLEGSRLKLKKQGFA